MQATTTLGFEQSSGLHCWTALSHCSDVPFPGSESGTTFTSYCTSSLFWWAVSWAARDNHTNEKELVFIHDKEERVRKKNSRDLEKRSKEDLKPSIFSFGGVCARLRVSSIGNKSIYTALFCTLHCILLHQSLEKEASSLPSTMTTPETELLLSGSPMKKPAYSVNFFGDTKDGRMARNLSVVLMKLFEKYLPIHCPTFRYYNHHCNQETAPFVIIVSGFKGWRGALWV